MKGFELEVKIRPKILLLLGAMSLALVGSLYALSYGLVERNLLDLEAQNARYRLAQVTAEFDGQLRYIEAVNRDWSSWDETYSFLENPASSNYLAENINDNVFKYLQLNIFIIYDRELNIFHFSFYDQDGDIRPARAEIFQKAFEDFSLFSFSGLNNGSQQKVSGFVVIDSTPVLISVQPVLHNDFTGPSPGWLLVGQIFDQDQVDRSSGRDNLHLSLKPLAEAEPGQVDAGTAATRSQSQPNRGHNGHLNFGERDQPEFEVVSRNGSLTARLTLPDLTGRP